VSVATLQELLEAGVHFGHQTKRWNPKMKRYIWGERNGIYIVDLTKTTVLLDKAFDFVKRSASQGKKVVFVGTKKQAVDIVEEEAKRCGSYYINKRWPGGMLTNFETIRTRLNRLRELEDMMGNGHMDRLPKKEVSVLMREHTRLSRIFGGVKDMRGMPDLIFIIDQKREVVAVQEANKINIPVVGIIDTNCDPTGVDYVIPGNDDAIRSLRLITSRIADAIIEGKAQRQQNLSRSEQGNAGNNAPAITAEEMAGVGAATAAVVAPPADAV
jgi:small subunit ribosomal protein S2